MKLTEDESKELDEYLANPFYRDIIHNAPDEKCRDYIAFGLIHGLYCGYDPEQCREHQEEGLTVNDWKYIKRTLAGNDPFLPKCITRITELEKSETTNGEEYK